MIIVESCAELFLKRQTPQASGTNLYTVEDDRVDLDGDAVVGQNLLLYFKLVFKQLST